MVKENYKGIESRKSRYGFMFVLPWIIGFVLFFLLPLVQSVWYSFSKVGITGNGIVTEFVSIKNYWYLLIEDPNYLKLLKSSLTSFLYSLPLILVISIVLALILNQKFRGRLIFRSLFFLPVIIANGVVLELLFKTTSDTTTTVGVAQSLTANMFSVEDVMAFLNLPTEIAKYVQTAISNIFNLVWNCGIQIILFIAGLQSIPSSVYEASKVEGATKWEEFWFITFPQISRVTFLVAIFTMVELFTDKQNAMVSKAYMMMSGGNFDETSAMLWFYFLIVGAIMGIVIGLYTHYLLKKWE